MYKLFNVPPTREVGIHLPPTWAYIKEGLQSNLERVTRYYRRSPMAVKSNHMLVRLLHSISVPKSQHIIRYYNNVSDVALNVAMSMGITSSIYKGRVFEGVFYGEGSQEIIIAHDEPFDYNLAEENWETLEPVKVIRHPRSDLGMNIPDGTRTGTEDGTAVILINIPMLAIQYRAFRMNEARFRLFSGGSERSIYQFVHMYPLTNMVKSHTDCALFNRITNQLYGYPIGESTEKHSFALRNFENALNKYNEEVVEYIGKHSCDFFTTLRMIKLLSSEDMAEFIELPNIPPTRQVCWALSFGVFPELVFLFRAAKDSATRQNATEVNRVLHRIQEYRYSNIVKSCVPTNMYIEFEQTIDELFELADRRM